jgi:hypothetical protein
MKARALPGRCGIAYALIQIASRIAPRKSGGRETELELSPRGPGRSS